MYEVLAKEEKETIKVLPHPTLNKSLTVEKAIETRRSVRSYTKKSLTLNELSQLLWAAQGITNKRKELRTTPSAGALYPLELYVVVGDKVVGLEAGVYKYVVSKHELIVISEGDKRSQLSSAALGQSWVAAAPASIVVCGVYERTRRKYGARAERYVHMEVGAGAENVYLQGRALQIGTVFVGAFDDDQVKSVIAADPEENPLAILPLGKI